MLVLALTLTLTSQPAVVAVPPGSVTDAALRSALWAAAPRWPAPRVDAVARAIQDSGLPAELVLGLIHTESRFVHHAQSSRGARGVMQLMPATARAFAAQAGVVWRGADTLDDPAASVRIGAAYLRHLRDRFRGDTALALAAYAHGPTRVRRALREHGQLSARAHGYARRVHQHEAHYARALVTFAAATRAVPPFPRSVTGDPLGPDAPESFTRAPHTPASPLASAVRAVVYAAGERGLTRAWSPRARAPALL